MELLENEAKYLQITLKALREESGLSGAKLALKMSEAAGINNYISKSSVMNYEEYLDKTMGISTRFFTAFSSFYGVSKDFLLAKTPFRHGEEYCPEACRSIRHVPFIVCTPSTIADIDLTTDILCPTSHEEDKESSGGSFICQPFGRLVRTT